MHLCSNRSPRRLLDDVGRHQEIVSDLRNKKEEGSAAS